jgi:hypothetical protein
MYPAMEGSSSIEYCVCNKYFFSLVHETHWEIGGGGRNQMFGELQRTYKNCH